MQKRSVVAEYCTEIGPVRTSNQDNLYLNGLVLERNCATASGKQHFREFPMLFAVCDGMGGERHGVEAALAAVTLLTSCHHALTDAPKQAFDRYVMQANQDILQLGRAGSTLVALALTGDIATVAHLGDSRAYLHRNGELTRLTEDHTQSQFVSTLNGQGHGNILTRHLGMDMPGLVIRPSYRTVFIQRGDRFLLCSDGLTGALEAGTIAAVLQKAPHPAQALGKAALQSGTMDNVTTLVVKIM